MNGIGTLPEGWLERSSGLPLSVIYALLMFVALWAGVVAAVIVVRLVWVLVMYDHPGRYLFDDKYREGHRYGVRYPHRTLEGWMMMHEPQRWRDGFEDGQRWETRAQETAASVQ